MQTSQQDPTKPFGQQAAAGGAWSMMTNLALQGLSLLQVALLGRLLTPEDFGVVGIAVLVTQTISVFIYIGYEYAIVQFADLTEEDLHTVWWLMLGRGALIAAGIALLARPIAALYNAPEAIPVLYAMAAIQFALGLANPAASLLQRDLRFKRLFEYQVTSAIVGLVVGVALAFAWRNVWALVAATAATTAAQIILSYVFHPYRPRRVISKSSIRRLSSFGSWMLGAAVLWFIVSQGTTAFAGWMFGVAALGVYQMASRFALLPSTQLGETVLNVAFPTFSAMQSDIGRVRDAFLRVFCLSVVLLFGVTALVALGLPYILVTILGNQWAEAAWLIPALSLAGCARAVLRIGSPIFLAMGRPRFLFLTDLVQTLVMAVLLYPLGTKIGLSGLPYASLLGALLALTIWWHGIHQILCVSVRQVIRLAIPASLATIVMVLIFQAGKGLLLTSGNIIEEMMRLLVLMVVSLGGYVMVILGMQHFLRGYQPLIELKLVFSFFWSRLAPLFVR